MLERAAISLFHYRFCFLGGLHHNYVRVLGFDTHRCKLCLIGESLWLTNFWSTYHECCRLPEYQIRQS